MEKRSATDRILAAARNLVARKGYTGATTREIAAAAKVNEVTLFRKFGTKEKLLYEAIAASFPEVEEAPLAALLGRPARDVDGLVALVADFAAYFSERALGRDRELILIALREAGDRPELRELFASRSVLVSRLLERRLRELEGEGLLREGTAGESARLLVCAILGAFAFSERGAAVGILDPRRAAELVIRGASVPARPTPRP
ncbi:MAG: TetR/AcrR family transcriptional regulator [Spirochaetaceae bacterium]|nr:TetR/AcrR family transcriptional regulator [Spirochaetaceae bacterium]